MRFCLNFPSRTNFLSRCSIFCFHSVPAIGFAQDYYTFSEGDINAAVQITIGHVIYQDITFTLKGGLVY